MTTRQTTAGTASDGFRCDDPPPIPRPRSSGDDCREPGRRAEPKERQR